MSENDREILIYLEHKNQVRVVKQKDEWKEGVNSYMSIYHITSRDMDQLNY